MSFGQIYSVSFWGETNDPNGWGSVYPFDADGGFLLADSTQIKSDATKYNADNTIQTMQFMQCNTTRQYIKCNTSHMIDRIQNTSHRI